jgi:hypothetical protein
MPCGGMRSRRGRGEAVGLHTVHHAIRSLHQRLAAWWITRRQGSHPAEVVIGTLRTPKLAIAIRVTVGEAEATPPPIAVFLKVLVKLKVDEFLERDYLPTAGGDDRTPAERAAMVCGEARIVRGDEDRHTAR